MSHIIAMAGKGGTGKTTLAALFIRQLVAKGHRPVLAIDADANDNLAEGIGVEKQGTIAEMTDVFFKDRENIPAGMPKEAYLEMKLNGLITEGKDIDMLVMGHPEGAGCYCYVNNILKAHMEQLVTNYPFTIVDNEAGMEHMSRRTSRQIDTLLLVADYSQKAVKAAARIREVAEGLKLEVGKMGLIINRAPADISPLKDIIEASGLDLLHVIPASSAVAENDALGKSVFELPDDDPVVSAVAELVEKMANEG
jgi:CO dehydrogenase maturation factor